MNISPAIQKAFGRTLLQVQKHSPAILTTVGVVGVVAAGILAAKNTLKLEATVDEGQARLQNAKSLVEEGEASEKAITVAYTKNVIEVAKLYVAPTTLMVTGLVCILSAQNILNKRNAALAAAYKGLESAFGAYRERVREELGEEREEQIRYGLREEEVTDEKGKKTKVLKPVDGQHVGSEYRFVYDVSNENWSGFHDDNLFRVTMVQNMANDILKAKGHIFLSEVLDTLGFERTPASIITGWVYDKDNPNHPGDNQVDFGIRDFQDEHGFILLDFNVDGTIFDKIGKNH